MPAALGFHGRLANERRLEAALGKRRGDSRSAFKSTEIRAPVVSLGAASLVSLAQVAKSLKKARTFEQVKSIRDQAVAVCAYARSAALGHEIQNRAAEIRLRAERRAGEVLSAMVAWGGDRKSGARDELVTLRRLRINHNQSSRWKRAAMVPEKQFEAYLAESRRQGKNVTAQGLLKIAQRLLSGGDSQPQAPDLEQASSPQRACRLDESSGDPSWNGRCPDEEELAHHSDASCRAVVELGKRCDQLARLLLRDHNGNGVLKLVERQQMARLIGECSRLLVAIEELVRAIGQTWNGESEQAAER